MKYSSIANSSRQPYPHDDARPLVRRIWEAFGGERILWGSLGHTPEEFRRNDALLDRMFDFAGEANRARIRAGNAVRLFGFRL